MMALNRGGDQREEREGEDVPLHRKQIENWFRFSLF